MAILRGLGPLFGGARRPPLAMPGMALPAHADLPLPSGPVSMPTMSVGAGDMQMPQARTSFGDRLREMMADPATKRAMLAAGATMMATGNVGSGILAGIDANDRYNAAKAAEAIAKAKAEADAERLGLERRRVDALERKTDADIEVGYGRLGVEQGRLQIDRERARSDQAYRQSMARAALMNAATNAFNAKSLAEYRKAMAELGFKKLEQDRLLAEMRAATGNGRLPSFQTGRTIAKSLLTDDNRKLAFGDQYGRGADPAALALAAEIAVRRVYEGRPFDEIEREMNTQLDQEWPVDPGFFGLFSSRERRQYRQAPDGRIEAWNPRLRVWETVG